MLIWYLRKNEEAKKTVEDNIPFSISVITYMEIIQGMRNKEELSEFLFTANDKHYKFIPNSAYEKFKSLR